MDELQRRINNFINKPKKGRTGRFVGGSLDSNPSNGAPRNKIWVRAGAVDKNDPGREVIPAWNYGKVSTRKSDAPVEIHKNSEGEWTIKGADEQIADSNAGSNASMLYYPDPPAPELSSMALPARNLVDLKPILDPIAGGLTLKILPGWLPNGRWFPGGTLDQTGYKTGTADSWAWVVAGIDLATLAPVAATGGDFALSVPPHDANGLLYPSTAPQTADLEDTIVNGVFEDIGSVAAANVYVVSAVALDDDAATFTNANGTGRNKIHDLRGTGAASSATAFTDLSDVPASYSGQGSKTVRVKSAEDGLEFVTGGGASHAYVGYNTVGGTSEQTTANRMIAKKITVASAGLLMNIALYAQGRADDATTTIFAGVWTDNAGVPDAPLAASAELTFGLDDVDGGGAGPAGWFALPIGLYLAAGDYWIGVAVNTNGFDIFKDTSGTDVYWAIAGAPPLFIIGGQYFTNTVTTDRYSIRASFLSL